MFGDPIYAWKFSSVYAYLSIISNRKRAADRRGFADFVYLPETGIQNKLSGAAGRT